MAYFPFFMDLEGKKGLIVGGGKVAYHKVKILLDYGPELLVAAPEICGQLEELEGRVSLCRRGFLEEDLKHCDFAVAAADDPAVNQLVSRLCRERKIPVNVVDVKEECSFIFPALVRQGDITVGISTSGSSPAAAQFLKQAIKDVIPDCFEELVRQLGEYRGYVKERVGTLPVRTAVYKEMAAAGIANGGRLTKELVDQIIEEKAAAMAEKETKVIRIGTRRSDLAVIQAKLVAEALKQAEPGIRTELVYKMTEGDRILDRPLLSFGGKGVFVTEFEEALRKGEIDLAVHSAKDLPMDLAEGLAVVGIPKREDPRDVLVTVRGRDLKEKKEIIVGTSSLRRKAQIGKIQGIGGLFNPEAEVICKDLRGNVITRLKKMESGEYDCEILAAAGLKRLGLLSDERYQFTFLECEDFVPAGGQGILAVEGRENDWICSLAKKISHRDSGICLAFERKVLRILEAGCHEPVGVYSRVQGEHICGWGICPFCGWDERVAVEGPVSKWADLAMELAGRLKKKKTGFVWLVGAGPGDPGLITKKGIDCLKQCDSVVYDYLSNDQLLDYVKPDCNKIYVGKKAGKHSASQEEINRILVDLSANGDSVVRLKGGDPYVFGRGGEEVLALEKNKIPYEVVPGVTSAVAALSCAGIPVTHRGMSRSFHVMTGHTLVLNDQENRDGSLPEDFPAFAKLSGTLVFLMGLKNLPLIVEGLMAAGKSGSMPAAVIEQGTMPEQRVVRGTLGSIVEEVKKAEIGSPAIIAVGETAGLDFRSKELLSNQSLTAKEETVRAASGAKTEVLPLAGVKFGLTGTENFVGKLTKRLQKSGAVTETICRMKIRSYGKSETVQKELKNLTSYTWLVFTSANGVRIFFEELLESGLDYRSLGHLRLAAVGSGTAEELKKFGFLADFLPETFCTESLAAGLVKKLTGNDRVLIPRSAAGAEILTQILDQAGIEFCDLGLYDVCGEEKDSMTLVKQMKEQDYLVFGSASGVDAVFGCVEAELLKGGGQKIACIGRFTAERLEHYGFRAAAVAETYDIEGLIKILCG